MIPAGPKFELIPDNAPNLSKSIRDQMVILEPNIPVSRFLRTETVSCPPGCRLPRSEHQSSCQNLSGSLSNHDSFRVRTADARRGLRYHAMKCEMELWFLRCVSRDGLVCCTSQVVHTVIAAASCGIQNPTKNSKTLRLRTTECCKMANDKNKEEDVNTSIKKARTETPQAMKNLARKAARCNKESVEKQ